MRKTDKKTQVETCDKFIPAANTEDLKLENHNKFKNQVTKLVQTINPCENIDEETVEKDDC
jgi:hypothetical protein